ncbi:hypothetical protein [Kineococcus sp. SYSU DK003]|uniref:hypothetical protein n=1 Tax=Kineococcus sp. SYSU DK003 TaxID=3383124 RepID=UPI003D7D33D3
MSEQIPQGDFSPGFDDPAPSRGLDGRALRALVAGAAGITVLGAFTGGYLWLSSSPSADAASAVAPGVSPGSVPTGTATGSAGSFAFGGKDIFDDSFLPADTVDGAVSAGDGTSSGTTGASTTTATGTTKSGSTGSTSGGSTVSTGTTGGAVTTSAPTGTSSTAPSPSSTGSTPTPSRSTAAPWQKGSVKFLEILKDTSIGSFLLAADGLNPVSATLADGSLLPSTSTVYRPQGKEAERPMDEDEIEQCKADKRDLVGDALDKLISDTKDCTITYDFVYQAVLVPSKETRLVKGEEASGWVLQSKTQLPDASLGKVSGTVRWLATRGETVLVQVGNAPGQWVEKGDSVEGSPLTFVDLGLDSIGRDDVAVFSDGTSQYFTVLGGGEGSGVSF